MHTVLILIKTLSINTAYMFHSMYSLYSSIQCILETNFSYVLCRWMINEIILVLDGEGQFVLRGGGASPLSHPKGGGSQGSGRDRPQGRGGRFDFLSAVMTVAAEADTSTRGASLDHRESSSSQL